MEKKLNEVAEVFRQGYSSFKSGKKLPVRIQKLAKDIMECRTAKMGGHKIVCSACGNVKISYNSCKNRHCPKCQFSKREQWILDRNRDLIPVSYFHVIFTVPHELNSLHLSHPRQMYDLLFKASWHALNEVVYELYSKPVMTGMIAVLHSWSQNLNLHPHLHCIIPAGVFDKQEGRWIGPKRHNLLCSIEALTQKFTEVYCATLNLLQKSSLLFQNVEHFNELFQNISNKVFNVNIQPAFQNPDHVIQYLGRYSHRVAITNSRIVKIQDNQVVFTYKDYRDNLQKEMTLKSEDFIGRFLMHILPGRFMKIRHFGFLSNKVKNEIIELILLFLKVKRNPKQIFDLISYFKVRFDIDLNKCSKCLKYSTRNTEPIPKARSDPNHYYAF